jgi:hypothetical protein
VTSKLAVFVKPNHFGGFELARSYWCLEHGALVSLEILNASRKVDAFKQVLESGQQLAVALGVV